MCPSFLPLPSSPGGGASDKHLLLFISHNLGCQYYIGSYRNDRFFPDKHGRMTWADNAYFAPEALVDNRGRQIMWAWVFDDRPDSLKNYYGWNGIYGLPRSLWVNKEGEPLTLRVFIDKGIVEVFANDRQAIARAVYPTLGGNGIQLFSKGGDATVSYVKTWDLAPSNPY
jgi:sucrose-6-phosphate hydrolase SacC (GH32 family)